VIAIDQPLMATQPSTTTRSPDPRLRPLLARDYVGWWHDSLVMLGQSRPDGWLGGSTPDARASTVSIYVVVADPDAHHERAQAEGPRSSAS
jgi:hypothetical protein